MFCPRSYLSSLANSTVTNYLDNPAPHPFKLAGCPLTHPVLVFKKCILYSNVFGSHAVLPGAELLCNRSIGMTTAAEQCTVHNSTACLRQNPAGGLTKELQRRAREPRECRHPVLAKHSDSWESIGCKAI